MKTELHNALKNAMRAKDKVRLNTIRSLLSAIQYEELQHSSEDLAEQQISRILNNEAKKRREGIEFAKQANRPEQIVELQTELKIIEEFLPQQLTDEELTTILSELKERQPDLNFGGAMQAIKEVYFGRYDGKTASGIAKRIFS